MSVTAAEIVERFDVRMQGTASVRATSIAEPYGAVPGDLAWLGCNMAPACVYSWTGSILLTYSESAINFQTPAAVIHTDNPRLLFIQVVRAYFGDLVRAPPRIDRSPCAQVHATAVIGAEGQGYEWDARRRLYARMPHLAGVVIEDDVDIGPCSTIMRGVLHDTVIGKGSKIGNGVNVGHGVKIGRNCIIAAHATIGGSTVVGDRVTIWQGATIANKLTIGNRAVIGMGAVVRDDVRDDTTVVGNPAREIC